MAFKDFHDGDVSVLASIHHGWDTERPNNKVDRSTREYSENFFRQCICIIIRNICVSSGCPTVSNTAITDVL